MTKGVSFMVDQERISRFKNMVEQDPNNELAHFSLARAYMDGDLWTDAVPELQKTLTLKRDFSKAYVLLGTCQKELGQRDLAVSTLTQGYRIAQERGDLMPRNEMGGLLKELGAEVPETHAAELTEDMAAAGQIKCKRCGRIAPKMAEPPFSGEFGLELQNSSCAPCFKEWIGQGTKVINELRLNLTEKPAQDTYDQHMREFLNL
jgi:Fe-S cluster biosynthesis and repair protein YggX